MLAFFCVGLAQASLVVGHRGTGVGSTQAPENSVPALVQALQDGATAVEFDVQLSLDGAVVLAHDARLTRISDGDGCVGEQTLVALQSLRLEAPRGWMSAPPRIPTLEEALAAIRPFDSPDRPFLADIHVKVYDGLRGDLAAGQAVCPTTDWETLARRTVEGVQAAGMLDRVLFSAFDARVLDALEAGWAEDARTGLLAGWAGKRAIQTAEGRFDAVILHVMPLDRHLLTRAHAAGLAFYSWTPNSLVALRGALGRSRVDGVITDRLGRALAIDVGSGDAIGTE